MIFMFFKFAKAYSDFLTLWTRRPLRGPGLAAFLYYSLWLLFFEWNVRRWFLERRIVWRWKYEYKRREGNEGRAYALGTRLVNETSLVKFIFFPSISQYIYCLSEKNLSFRGILPNFMDFFHNSAGFSKVSCVDQRSSFRDFLGNKRSA